MTEKQAEVAGHRWTPGSDTGCCSCGEFDCVPIGGDIPSIQEACEKQHAAHLAALASQVPAQPPAAVLVLEMREFAQECLQRIKMNPHTDGNELHTKDAYQKIIALCDFCDPSVESLPLEKKHEIARKIYDSQPAPVPAQGTPPAQPRTMQLPYRQEYAHIDTRHAEDDWCKKAGCVPSCPPAPESPQIADTLEQEIYALEKEGCYCDTAAANVCVVHAMSQSLRRALRRALRAELAESDTWRRLLWLNHARYIPGVHMPYGDDGEMQCCGIDFKRQSAAEIDEFLTRRALAAQPTPARDRRGE